MADNARIIPKTDLIYIDGLVEVCGYFTTRTPANNGYGCRHPDQDNVDKETGHGCCFPSSCPIARAVYHDQSDEDRALVIAQGMNPETTTPGDWLELDEDINLGEDPDPAPRAWADPDEDPVVECRRLADLTDVQAKRIRDLEDRILRAKDHIDALRTEACPVDWQGGIDRIAAALDGEG